MKMQHSMRPLFLGGVVVLTSCCTILDNESRTYLSTRKFLAERGIEITHANLASAVAVGDTNVVAQLHRIGCDEEDRNTPFVPMSHLAWFAFYGDLAGVRQQLALGVPVDDGTLNPGGYTALMLACENGRRDVARCLINAGADVNFRYAGRESFVGGGYEYCTPLVLACGSGVADLVWLLLANGADTDMCGRLALHAAAGSRDRSRPKDQLKILQMLRDRGVSLNDRQEGCPMPINSAVYFGPRVTQWFLDNGASVDGHIGAEALQSVLSLHGDKDALRTLELLLRHGADPNALARCGRVTHVDIRDPSDAAWGEKATRILRRFGWKQ